MYDKFESRDTVVVAIAQEDKDLKSHAQLAAKIKPDPKFPIVADLKGKTVRTYDRTTAYLIDKEGVVRQVFPMLIRNRPSWNAILQEVDRINGAS